MSDQSLQEVWQVEVGGQVYEAPFGELGDWIAEGSLQPDDRVRRGNLRWIEARKVPNLIPFFNAKSSGSLVAPMVKTVDAQATEPPEQPLLPASAVTVVEESVLPLAAHRAASADPHVCATHPQMAAFFRCDGCGAGLCKACPKSYGGTVKICPLCGALCRSVSEVQHANNQEFERAAAMGQGFGMGDFGNSIAFPLRFKASLFLGALMFAFFTLGRSVTVIGGIYMIVAGIFSAMLANMLTFGILANTVQNFSQGRLDENFMPTFDDFSLWDDVAHPFFLGIGVYMSSFGPFILALLVGFYFVMNSVGSHMDSVQSDLEKIPGTHYYDQQRTVKQSEDVRDVLGEISNKQNQRIAEYNEIAAGNSNVVIGREEDEAERLWNDAQQARKAQLEAMIGKSPETEAEENAAMIQGFLNLAPPLVVIGAIFFLWGLFYFPAACAVAGYTRSFGATVNPLVGLDTIKRLGGTYIKILFMGFLLLLASGIVSGLLSLIFSSFDLPGFGNVPAKWLGAVFTFYISVIFSCILGYALFKAADKLELPR